MASVASNNPSVRSAGRACKRACETSDPAFPKQWATPGGTFDHREALLLNAVDMPGWDVGARWQEVIEDHKLAASLRAALPDDDVLGA